MKCHRYFAITMGVSLLTGCITTNPKVTSDEVAHFQSPKAFMTDRLKQGLIGFKKPKLLSDGTIVYTAYYTGMNTRNLRKPSEDAKGYCEAKGGKWSVISTTGLNLGAGQALSRRLAGIEQLGAQQGVSPDTIASAKQRAIINSQQQNQHSGLTGAQRIIDTAARNGHLGKFNCKAQQGNWQISVNPVASKLADPRNKLTSHELILHVSVSR